MTTEERAEKIRNMTLALEIVNHVLETQREGSPIYGEQSTAWVAAQIREAYEEGKRDSIIEFCEGDRSMLAEYEQKAYAKGRTSMREEAVKVVCEMVNSPAADKIAERIRAISVDGVSERPLT